MNIENFIKVIESQPNKFKKSSKKIILETAVGMNRDMAEKVPVDTGYLKRTIGYELKDDGLTCKVGANIHGKADYASYVEYGTRYQRSQPYFNPSFDKAEKEFKQKVKGLK